MKASDRKRVLAVKRVRKLSLAVTLKDAGTPDTQPRGNVFVKAAGKEIQPGQGGLYALMDLSGPVFSVTVGGARYQEEVVAIDVAGLEPLLPVKELWLKERGQLPPDTVLAGQVDDIATGLPVAGAKITVKARSENATSGADGSFSLVFKGMETDDKVTLYINSPSYRAKQATIQLKSHTTTAAPIIKLTKI